ncbi:hypothetical protein BCS42_01395 [Crenothrix sp. D3]|nr:hypothetical protein BCS42_01395 [Crenothrix sp. D3]
MNSYWTNQPPNPRIEAIPSLKMVNVFQESITKKNIASMFVDIQTFLFVKVWVKNVANTKNVWIDVHIFDRDDVLIGANTLTLQYEGSADGNGDFFLLQQSIYQSACAGPGWCSTSRDDQKIQYRLYYEVNNQIFTDGILHEFNLY